jgi:hypothetical protein
MILPEARRSDRNLKVVREASVYGLAPVGKGVLRIVATVCSTEDETAPGGFNPGRRYHAVAQLNGKNRQSAMTEKATTRRKLNAFSLP